MREYRGSYVALFSTLFNQCAWTANRILGDEHAAADVASDAMLTLYRHWARVNPKGRRAWVIRVTTNLAFDVLKSRARFVATDPTEPLFQDQEVWLPTPTLPLAPCVIAALNRLPPRQREAMVLRYIADYSEKEVAQRLGITAGALKSHLSRGRKSMRKYLKRYAGDLG